MLVDGALRFLRLKLNASCYYTSEDMREDDALSRVCIITHSKALLHPDFCVGADQRSHAIDNGLPEVGFLATWTSLQTAISKT